MQYSWNSWIDFVCWKNGLCDSWITIDEILRNKEEGQGD
jgi:hypothetical protein